MESVRIKEILQDCKTDGNTMFLGKNNIPDYADFKKSIISMGGKYNRNKFEFDMLADIALNALLNTKGNFQQDFQYFPTPKKVLDEMLGVYADYPARVLEPSAGQGAIIEYMLEDGRFLDSEICYCELSEYNQLVLQGKNLKANFLQDDFMTLDESEKFDLIIANPPFAKNAYAIHIMKMLSHLKDEGVLLVIAPANWKSNKKLDLNGLEVHSWDIPSGAFSDSNTNVATSYLYITKHV
jgi:16S rRNA G966 N2-methylase RsmD